MTHPGVILLEIKKPEPVGKIPAPVEPGVTQAV